MNSLGFAPGTGTLLCRHQGDIPSYRTGADGDLPNIFLCKSTSEVNIELVTVIGVLVESDADIL